jgi:hypothetical protein
MSGPRFVRFGRDIIGLRPVYTKQNLTFPAWLCALLRRGRSGYAFCSSMRTLSQRAGALGVRR